MKSVNKRGYKKCDAQYENKQSINNLCSSNLKTLDDRFKAVIMIFF